jgi:hypothetical protein
MRSIFFAIAVASAGCSGTTGSGLVTFSARAGGAADVTPSFVSGNGFAITLTQAQLHVGAVYLNLSVPSSGAAEEPCVLPGVYAGEAFGPCHQSVCGLDVDLLSPALTTFTTTGAGIASSAAEAQVWLTSGDINAATDPTPVFTVAGTAAKAGQSFPFAATITIGSNRAIPPPNVASPGANPICQQRIVTPIPLLPRITLASGGRLDLRVDVRIMFDNLDFTQLSAGSDGVYVIPDAPGGVGGAFFAAVTGWELYTVTFTP